MRNIVQPATTLLRGRLLVKALLLATGSMVSAPSVAQAQHFPSASGYYFPGCSVSSGGYPHYGQNQVYFTTQSWRYLSFWRYSMYGYPVHMNKNNNDFFHYTNGSGGWGFISPDSLPNTQSFREVPGGWFTYQASAGHYLSWNGDTWHSWQSNYVFDRPGADPSCWSGLYP